MGRDKPEEKFDKIEQVGDSKATELSKETGKAEDYRQIRQEVVKAGMSFSMTGLDTVGSGSKFELTDSSHSASGATTDSAPAEPRTLSRPGQQPEEPKGSRDLEYLGDKPPAKTSEGYYEIPGVKAAGVLADADDTDYVKKLTAGNPGDRNNEDNAAMRVLDQLKGGSPGTWDAFLKEDVMKDLNLLNDKGGAQDAAKYLGGDGSKHTIQSLENIANTEINKGRDASAPTIAAVLHELHKRSEAHKE